MIPVEPRPALVGVLAALALFALVAVARGTRGQAYGATRAVPGGVGVLGMVGRIVAVQWLVITYAGHRGLVFWLVLAVPAVLAAVTLVRALTVTVFPGRGGGRW
jgi:uncharacterized protein involved in cysteine biosynthesis